MDPTYASDNAEDDSTGDGLGADHDRTSDDRSAVDGRHNAVQLGYANPHEAPPLLLDADLLWAGVDDETPSETLASRSVQAAVFPDAAVHALVERIDDLFGTQSWDQPWVLYGLSTPVTGSDLERALRTGPLRSSGLDAPAVLRPLVAMGEGHPGLALQGRYAPDDVFGLVLVTEGSLREFRSDSTRTGTEVRLFIANLSDGRWFQRLRVRDLDQAETVSAGDGLEQQGMLPVVLARVLGMAVELVGDVRGVALQLLGAMALTSSGVHVASLIARDPVLITARLHSPGDGATNTLEEAAMLEWAERICPGGIDWVGDDTLLAFDSGRAETLSALLAHLGGLLMGLEAHMQRWWGREALLGLLSERLKPLESVLEELGQRDGDTAAYVRRVIERRCGLWGLDPQSGVSLRVTPLRNAGY